jgi:hypothetical protein
MSWFQPKPKKHSEQFHVPKLCFLGEQDGLPERELKCCLIEFFQRDLSIVTAYLAQLAYGDQSPMTVTLCLRTQFGFDPGIAEKVGRIFASMFGEQEHMDIIFLDDQQECELSKVCSPFFGDTSRSRCCD